MKALAYREVWRETGAKEWGLQRQIAAKLKKIGGGKVTSAAVGQLFSKIDDDPAWYPGKSYQESHGPKPVLDGAKRRCIAASAMALKDSGSEPTFALVVAQCPRAALNPNTGKLVDPKLVYKVLRKDCYDHTPDKPWTNRPRLQKVALPAEVKEKRLAWGKQLQRQDLPAAWFFRHVLWMDICASVLPRTEAKAKEQALARKGQKGWFSDGSAEYSQNLRGSQASLKQASWGTVRVWWAPVLVRGKLHVVYFGKCFPGETPEGAALIVNKLPGVLATRFPNEAKPKVVMTDRGQGFFDKITGQQTPHYGAALEAAGLRALAGHDASGQPGNLQDLMLHETAVAWVRWHLQRTLPRRPWDETCEEYGQRLNRVCAKVNAQYDVAGLCREFPSRIAKLVLKEGDRLRK